MISIISEKKIEAKIETEEIIIETVKRELETETKLNKIEIETKKCKIETDTETESVEKKEIKMNKSNAIIQKINLCLFYYAVYL